jgi:hypothetical protein
VILPRQLLKCLKPDCLRKVPPGVQYCCIPCAAAAEGRYEIHAHSASCEYLCFKRGGEWTWAEAQAHLQAGAS